MNVTMDEDSQESNCLGFPHASDNLASTEYKRQFFQVYSCEDVITEENTSSQLDTSTQSQHDNSYCWKPVVFNQCNETCIDEDDSTEGDFLGFLSPTENLYSFYLKKNITVRKKKYISQKEAIEIFVLHSYETRSSFENLNSGERADENSIVNANAENINTGSDSETEENEAKRKTKEFISDYERIRLNSIKERNEYFIQMGLMKKNDEHLKKSKVKKTRKINENQVYPVRRSTRLSHSLDDADFHALPYDAVSDDSDENRNIKKIYVKRPNTYGIIKGVPIGESWKTRLECNAAGIHRPTVAGIHPGPKGAYSVVLSGGYDDDIDEGETFVYTGSGGRDLKGTKTNPKNLRTAPQSKDQTLNMGNASLIYSSDHKKPIRVVRGYKLKSHFAPEEGYRYDGLYEISKWWLSQGHSGFFTYKFLFKRCDNQDPPPWSS